MLKNLFIAFIYDLVKLLNREKKFLFGNKDERSNLLDQTGFKNFSSLKNYLNNVNENSLLEDLKTLVEYLKNPVALKVVAANSSLITAFGQFLSEEFADYLDEKNYQPLSSDQFPQTIKHSLDNCSYQEITENIYQFLKNTQAAGYLVVQSPRPIDEKLKKSIRHNLQNKAPLSLPIFQVNINLIGGLRLFLNGQVKDNSWLGKINAINQLKI